MNKCTELLSYKETIKMFVEAGLTNFYNLNSENTQELVAAFINDNTDYSECIEGIEEFDKDNGSVKTLILGLLLDNGGKVSYCLKRITNAVIDFYGAHIQHDIDEELAEFKIAEREEIFIQKKNCFNLAGMGDYPDTILRSFSI